MGGSSGIEAVTSLLVITKVHLFDVDLRASIYESCLKSDPDRRIGIPFTVCRLYF